MPKKRHDSRSDEDSSSDSSEGESSHSSASKKRDHRRSRRDSVSKHPPSRDVKYRDHRHHKESSGIQRQTSSIRHHSLDSSRRHSPFQDRRRADERTDTRRRGEKDRQDQYGVNRRDREMNQRRVGEKKDRIESRHRSKDNESERRKKVEDKGSTSHSRDKNRSKGGKEDENYSSQQTSEKGKDKSSSTDTRRVRNDDKDGMLLNPAQKPSSKNSLKEKAEARSSDNSKASDKSYKDDKRIVPETKKSKHNEKEVMRERKRKISDSTSSSSNSEEYNSSDSDSDIAHAAAARSKSKSMKASKESTVVQLKQPETETIKSDLVDHTVDSEKEKVAEIEKKVENPRKDAAERNHDSSNSGSDPSEDERESKISKHKRGNSQIKENLKKEAYKHLSSEDGSKAITPQKQQSLSQERIIVNKSRDVDSDEEKEEGEISEDNEDKIPDKPLKALSNYVSDISSDDGQPETTEPKEVEKQQTAPLNQFSSVTSRIPSDVTKRNEENVEQLGKSSKSGKTDKKMVAAVNQKVSDLGNDSGKLRKKVNDFSDSEVVEGEDNSKRQRPVLESESDDEGNDRDVVKSSLRSKNQSKLKMGSFVSVVKQSGRRDRDSSVDRNESSRRVRDDGHSRDRRDRGTRSRQDTDKEKREGVSETKGLSDKSEQKTPSSTKPAKPDSDNAAKTTEDSGKKPVTAIDITTRTGGAYIPPAKLRMMQELITDKTSVAYQRMSWEALKKSINGLINKVNVSNIVDIIKDLFKENIVRGRGLLARSVIQAQAASPTFTHVYAALVAVINTRFPQNGELILRRLILMFRRGYKRNDKALCLSSTTFIAHLVNQQVAHEVLALEILTLLLENPTDDSVEIAVGFLKECGQKLTEVTPRGINSIFERLRNVLHEGLLDVRVQYMVEVMFAIRKDGFKDHISVMSDLDLVEEEEQFTHLLQLEDAVAGDEMLNVFKADPAFAENEEKYKTLKKEILDEGSSDEGSQDESGSGSSDSDDEEKENAEKQTIIDKTETNLVALRRTIYLTIQSSLDHNECAHKILKMDMKPGQEVELCNMILDCCAQLRTYEKFFGLLAQRFCQMDKKYIEPFQQIFLEQYETIHRLETNKLRNVAKLFAHLLHTDAISWGVLSVVKLTEEETTAASRIFLKVLFQELSEYMGLLKLNERLKDPTLSPYFQGIMARDNPKNTRFCINFFTTIGLGGLTDDLREHLKTATKQIAQQNEEAERSDNEDVSSSTDSSSDSSDSDTSSDSGSDSPSKRKHKSAASKTKKKNEKETSKSKTKATDSKNKKASRQKHKSSDGDSKSESRSKSSSKGGRPNERNVSPDKSRRTIADRLLDMAQYGNVRNGGESFRDRNERDRWDREKEVRPNFNRRDADEGRKSGREDQEYFDNFENEERWGQSRKRWNSIDEGGDRRREENVGQGNRSGEDRVHRVEDERRMGGRQDQVKSFRRENDFHQRNNNSLERRVDLGSGNNRRWGNEYNRQVMRPDKVNDEDRERVLHRGEKRKDKRHDSSSEESDSSLDKGKKKSGRGRNLSTSPEKKNRKRSLEAETTLKQGNKKQQDRYETSDEDSSSDSSDDSHSKLSKSRKEDRHIQASKSKSNPPHAKKRKKSLSSSGSQSSSSSTSSDEEVVQERRIITKKPRLVGDKNLKRQDVLEDRSSDKDRVRRRK